MSQVPWFRGPTFSLVPTRWKKTHGSSEKCLQPSSFIFGEIYFLISIGLNAPILLPDIGQGPLSAGRGSSQGLLICSSP
jgi:hypothetical protein